MTDTPTPPSSVPPPTDPTPPTESPKRPWTILGRLTKAVREQNWFAVALELAIVVLGVVIGFQVTAWGQDQSDRAKEQEYLRQLAADLAETEQRLDEYDALNRPGSEALIKFIRAFSADPRPPADSLFVWGWESRTIEAMSPVVGTAEALVSTGDIRLIRNDTLRSEIAAHLDEMRLVDGIIQSVMLVYLQAFRGYYEQFDFSWAAQVALTPAELDSLARTNDLFADAPSPGRPPYPDPEAMLDNLELYATLRSILGTRGDIRFGHDIYRRSSRDLAVLVNAELNR